MLSNDVLWHKRFCHLRINNMKNLVRNDLVKGIDCKFTCDSLFCSNCCDGKLHRMPFEPSEKRDRKPLELIHSDVCGPITPESSEGGKYFLTFIDDSSRYVWCYIIKNKSDVFEKFQEFKVLVENL